MSDLRMTAACGDCDWWASGTSAIEWTSEHIDIHPAHRVTITRSGELRPLTA